MTRAPPLLNVIGLKKHFPVRGGVFGGVTGQVYAVDGVSFSIEKGETLSLVGESGCGKSTVGKAILRLVDPTAGEVWLDGARIVNCVRCGDASRWCSRTRSAASIRACGCATSSPNHCATSA